MRRLASLAQLHPQRVLLTAVAVFVVSVIFGGPVVDQLHASLSDFEDPSTENYKAVNQMERATGAADQAGLDVLLQTASNPRSTNRAVAGPALAQIEALATALEHQRGFRNVYDYATLPYQEFVSRNGRESMILASFATPDLSKRAAERLPHELPHDRLSFGGLDLVFNELTTSSRADLVRAELIAFPLLLLLCLWVFRGVVAALLPLLVAGLTIFGTFLCMRIIDHFVTLSVFSLNLVSAVGLGLAIDYSLFVVSRFREELAFDTSSGNRWLGGSLDSALAIRRTMATTGRTVLWSSLTVAAVMASLLIFPLRFLYSMGIAGTLTALIAGGVSLVVLPAILVLLGRRVNALAPKWMQRSRRRASRAEASGFWFVLARAVMRRPAMFALVGAGVLLAVGTPVLSLGSTPASASLLPTSAQPRHVEESILDNFTYNTAQPTIAVLKAPRTEAAEAKVGAYARELERSSGEFNQAQYLPLNANTWLVSIPPEGNPFDKRSEAIARHVRAVRAPFPVAIGGLTAWFQAQLGSIGSHLPIALAVVAVMMFATIFALTGSVVLPLQTLLMNLLTLWFTTGVLVLGFQRGYLSGLLDFKSTKGLEPSNLVVLFTLAFALASDYGVFLLGRIKEGHDNGLPDREAIALGLERTGRLVTAAALLFCVAIGALTSSSVLSLKELGFGAALAVAIDASIVRAMLVPSTMAVMGRWNWAAPGFMRRLHAQIGISEGGGAPLVGVLTPVTQRPVAGILERDSEPAGGPAAADPDGTEDPPSASAPG